MENTFVVEELPTPKGLDTVPQEGRRNFIKNFLDNYVYYYNDLYFEEEYSPLLDYVHSWGDEFENNRCVYRFLIDYFDEKISKIEAIKSKYEKSTEMLKTLDAYDIDRSKYFYLCMILKYDIDDYDNCNIRQSSYLEIIEEFLDKLDEMNPDKKLWGEGKVDHKAELSLKVDGVRGTFKTRNSLVINLVNYGVRQLYYKLKERKKECDKKNNDSIEGDWRFRIGDTIIDDSHEFRNDRNSISPTDKAYLFNLYLKWFLKEKKCKKGTGADISKNFLISRSYYVFEINENLDKDKFYNHDGNGDRAFKDLIKKCIDPRKKFEKNRIF